MIFTAVLALLLTDTAKSLVPPINEDDPELYVEWTTPQSFDFWWRYSTGSEFVGNLFAGRAEFPYIVDIRSMDLDSEKWSTGNLLTLTHVLTTARTVQFIVSEKIYSYWYQNEKEVDEGLVLSWEYVGVDVNFCGNYLWEEYHYNTEVNVLYHTDVNVFDHDVKDSGTRYARQMYRHPKWKEDSLSWDIGIIKVNFPIRPNPPVVDHMPIWFDNEKGQVTDVDLSKMIEQRRVCFVASFGRNWFNLYDSYVVDYKVRYRVYYQEMQMCQQKWGMFARIKHDVPLVYNYKKDSEHLMCFGTRARVGAICDHDRGAPLVCDGRVYGFVTRGANFSNCNNLLPLPFLVQKGSMLNQYYADVTRHVFVPKHVPKSGSRRIWDGAKMLVLPLIVWLRNHFLSTTTIFSGRWMSLP